jgi:hypothetical protein
MTTKKPCAKPEIILISGGDVDAKNVQAANESSFISDHVNLNSPSLHTLKFAKRTFSTMGSTVIVQDFVSITSWRG